MTNTERHTRLDVTLVRLGFLSFGLSVAGWLAARFVPSAPSQLMFQISAAFFIAALVLILAVAVLVQADLRRAVAMLKDGVTNAGKGLHVNAALPAAGQNAASLPGVYSRWSASVDHLVALVEDYSTLVFGLLDEIPSGVVLLTRDSRVRAANRSFFRIFDLDRQEVEGRMLQDILPTILAEQWSPLAVSAANWYGRDARESQDPASGRVFRTSLVQLPAGRQLKGLLALMIEEVDSVPATAAFRTSEFRDLYRGILDAFPTPLIVAGRGGP